MDAKRLAGAAAVLTMAVASCAAASAARNGNPPAEKNNDADVRPGKIYFSIFIHGLLVLGRKFGYDKGILMEAVYAMCLSPSPAGWYMGIMAVVDNIGGRNLIIAFIDYMVEYHRSVSAGPGRRRQPSHGRGIDTKELFVSIRNLARHATLASSSASTLDIVRGPQNPKTPTEIN